MITKLAERNFSASVRLMKKVEASCVALQPIAELRTEADLVRRALIVRSVLNARALFENLHRRTLTLTAALANFHARKLRIAGMGVNAKP